MANLIEMVFNFIESFKGGVVVETAELFGGERNYVLHLAFHCLFLCP